jgi:hypothetical protein
MKIVEMRIMSRAAPSSPDRPTRENTENVQAWSRLRSPKRHELSIIVDSEG